MSRRKPPAIPGALLDRLLTGDDGAQRVVEPCVRIYGVEFAGADQRGDHRPVLRPSVVTGEERALPVQRDGTHFTLHGVAVDLDAAVAEEDRKRWSGRPPAASAVPRWRVLKHRREGGRP
jgi:hypothetical protein